MSSSHDVTRLLRAWRAGDDEAFRQIVALVERDLHRIARGCLRGDRANRSLSATELVHEAFIRLVEVDAIDWADRAHFLAMSARAMRRVLVDMARARRAEKRGGDHVRVTLDEEALGSDRAIDVIRLEDALHALEAVDDRKSRVVEMRFFGGLSVEDTAAVLGISAKTVLRDWEFARAWLHREMTRDDGSRHQVPA